MSTLLPALSSSFEYLREYFGTLTPGQLWTLTAGLAASLYFMATRKGSAKPLKGSVDPNNQSVLIDEKTCCRASWLGKKPDYYGAERLFPDACTVYEALLRGRKVSNNGDCLGVRKDKGYEFLSYQEVIKRVHTFGSALVAKGERPENDNFVGIYATNRPEWAIADFGIQAYSMCPVALYDTLGIDALVYIINQCKMRTMVIDTDKRAKFILRVKDKIPTLGRVILVDAATPELQSLARNANVEICRFSDFMDFGKENIIEPKPPKPTDLFAVCYTSGTTGQPKGVMLTHDSFVKNVERILMAILPDLKFAPGDAHLSYLPLAHNFDRAVTVMMMINGAKVGYFSRDPALLMEDLQALKPTIYISVPRMFNRMYDMVWNEVKHSAFKSWLLRTALSSKTKQIRKAIFRRDTIWDKLIFGKIQANLGGRVKLVITGSAPLSTDVLDFLKCALGCAILEGYGQTESAAGITFSIPSETNSGAVGPPLAGYHVKLADVPEMGFYAKNNVGEVCSKSECTLKGYLHQPEITAETIDEEGWLHTGDIGTWLPNGTLKIVDRKKHIFKLSQGVYITPEKIEATYITSSFVAQCFIDGDSLKPCVLGVVVPEVTFIEKWAKINNLPTDLVEFCKSTEAKKAILEDVHKIGKLAELNSLEQAKDLILEPNLFSVDNNLLTPTMKNRRPMLRAKYKEQMAALYKQNNL